MTGSVVHIINSVFQLRLNDTHWEANGPAVWKTSTGMSVFVKAAPAKTEVKPQTVAATSECYLMDSETSRFTLHFNIAFISSILLHTRCFLYTHINVKVS